MLEALEVTKIINNVTVIKGISLNVGRGEVLGLVGLSGSGKTVFSKVLSYVWKPSSGKVLADGKEDKFAVGLVWQTPIFDKYKVIDYVEFFGIKGSEAKELLSDVNLEAKRRADSLSFFERKRLSLAIALAKDPSYVVFDDISGVGESGLSFFKEFILKLRNKGKGVIVTFHNISEIDDIVDRIAIIHRGKIEGVYKISEFKNISYLILAFDKVDEKLMERLKQFGVRYRDGNVVELSYPGDPLDISKAIGCEYKIIEIKRINKLSDEIFFDKVKRLNVEN
ncbi:ATP-binding cassette domain-containing protein [Candidatus Acidianus copahuensis]|uniref:ATP-binding cassette domain-containing protein n=1 Tax=Acidianus TaxID=12914 RepID=UPI00135F1BFC|nr:ABC transporter ATP-binding protein [Candidatus Acidianus copahuensis]NON61184.1 ABC transporter ATP-binding protein [Acidianus sp. RZ1]